MKNVKAILITGVAGFIGSNLLDFLMEETDWQITGVDNFSTGGKSNIEEHLSNTRFRFLEQKVSQIDSIKGYDVIFHLAALPRIQPSFELIREHVDANLNEALFLIEKMVEENHYPRLVYSGSSSIYGNPKKTPTDENEPIKCMNPYAFQKYEVEKYLEMLNERYPLNYVTLRYFNPYGPRSFNPDNPFNAYSSVVGIFMHRKKMGQPLLITGDGSQRRDFIHVRDVAAANYAAAVVDGKPNTAFNIGQGTTISVLELAQMISDDYEFIPARLGEADVTHADISKSQVELNWSPKELLGKFV
ncbi:MAG: NAD-dependent epimerase/dehydratase family protein [Salibacteraceae bacterium]